MNIIELAKTEIMKTAHKVDARNLFQSPDVMVTIIELQPGQKLIRHITPVDVVFYVLKGTGVVEIGEEKETVGENTLIESPKDIVHCWYNESDGPLSFMVIKAPKPSKPTKFIGD